MYERELLHCEIVENTFYTASFFPKQSFILKVVGKGFGRHQIRLMMGALIKLGRGEIDMVYIKNSLKLESEYVMDLEEEGEQDYHFQLAIQQSLGFESQNAEDGGNGVYDEPGFGAQTDEPFVDDEIR